MGTSTLPSVQCARRGLPGGERDASETVREIHALHRFSTTTTMTTTTLSNLLLRFLLLLHPHSLPHLLHLLLLLPRLSFFLKTTGDGNVNGFGLEFYIEAPASEFGDAADAAAAGFGPSTSSPPSSGSGPTLHAAKASWQFQLLYTVAQLAAGHGGIRAIMDEMRLLSTEAEGVAGAMPPSSSSSSPDDPSPNAVVTPAGRVGALLGLRADALAGGAESDGRAPPPPDRIPGMPLTDVLLVNVKLLTLGELGLITERGAAGRAALDQAFRGAGRLVSSLARPGVV